MVCHTCRTRLLFYDVGEYFRSQRRALCLSHHETCKDLLQSVESGCYMCNRLWATLGSGERNIAEGPAGRPLTRRQTITDSARDATVPVPQRAVTLLRIRQARDGNDHYYVEIAFCPKTSSFNPESEVQFRDALFSLQICQGLQTSEATLPNNTESDSSLTLAKSWVTECSMDHKQCAVTNTMPTSKWYPTRLLDIESLGLHSNFRLIETRDSNLQGPYMTLSHCWGFKECTSLETKNCAEMLRGHRLESQPQLYQDAAYVTKQLGDTVDVFPRGVLPAPWKLKNAREQEGLDSETPKNTHGRLPWKEMVEV